MNRSRIWLSLGIALIMCSAPVLQSQQAERPKSEEYLLFGDANRGAGEPFIFVNPKNPENMIVAAMATLHRLPSGEAPIVPRNTPEGVLLRVKELSVPDGSRTDIAVTHNGGKTWVFSEDNFRKLLDKNRCSDSFAGAGPDGTLYVGCLAYLNRGSAGFNDGYGPNGEARNPGGGSAIAWSRDEGKTWSDPKYVHPLRSPQLYPPDVHPVFDQVSPLDRPYFAADAQTGTIYVSGTGSVYTVDPATVPQSKVDPSLPGKGYTGYPGPNVSRGRTFIRASHDQAKTWGMIYPMDSDEYPGGRGSFSAAHGHLVVAYSATKVPEAEKASCPCTVFGVSENDGKNFAYRVIPPLPQTAAAVPAAGRGGRGGPGGGVMIGADPTKDGRYAVARQSGQEILVSVTQDGGKTWEQPVVAARLPDGASFGHRAMKYSAKGLLALMWKANYGDRTFDVWSSASKDGGSVFRTVRVSHAVSPPYIIERGNFMLGDDLSSLDLDERFVHIVWGDNRSGFEATWYGRVPLDAY